MARLVRDVMTFDPITCKASAPVTSAARLMRDRDIGDVLIEDDDGLLRGIVTDRDIVVRCVADERDPSQVTLSEICSDELVTVTPDTELSEAVEFMRRSAVRRLPVVDAGQAVGIVSIGDLAIEEDPASALADISAAEPNT